MSLRVLTLGIAIALSSSASVASGNPTHMVTKGRTSQPIGHYNYCKQYRSDCQIRTRDTDAPTLTRERWKELVEINAYSNNTIAPYTDQEIYNTEEHWAYPTSYGDCEDYVLMKRHMLMQKGWPASSLLITVVRQPNGDGHAVLTVRTDKADYILDNLVGKVRPWNKTPYTYLKRQDTKHSGRWIEISDLRSSAS